MTARPSRPRTLQAFLGNLAARGYLGCNVTLPHKEAAFRAVRIADEATQRLGVVNTVFPQEWRVFGAQAPTARASWPICARQSHPGRREASTSCCWVPAAPPVPLSARSLATRPAKSSSSTEAAIAPKIFAVILADRSASLEWSEAATELAAADLLVNTTSLGMAGQPPLDLDLASLAKSAMVSDIVYRRLKPRSSGRHARAAIAVAPGLGMLLHQAVRGFELWFGIRPEVTPGAL